MSSDPWNWPNGRVRLATPCLVVELSTLEANITRMADLCSAFGVSLRPHAKAHKCAAIARMQLAAGANGHCVATVGEAERLVASGLADLHLTSTVGSPEKAARIAALAGRGVKMSCVVDSEEMVALIGQAALAGKTDIDLLIDVDLGRHRAGVATVEEAVALARAVVEQPRVRLAGIQAYAGHLSHLRDFELRKRGASEVNALVCAMKKALSPLARGPLRITGGSTGSLLLDLEGGVFNELQCGSYVLMDVEYLAVDLDGVRGQYFEPALFLQTAVTSNRHPGMATTDGGDKRLCSKYGELPIIHRGAPDGSVYRSVSDEHGMVTLPTGQHLELDGRIECIVPHCDPTINLFQEIHVVRNNALVDIWPVTARGA